MKATHTGDNAFIIPLEGIRDKQQPMGLIINRAGRNTNFFEK